MLSDITGAPAALDIGEMYEFDVELINSLSSSVDTATHTFDYAVVFGHSTLGRVHRRRRAAAPRT